MVICVQCNREGGEGKFCENCGKPMISERCCPKCGIAVDSKTKFCPECSFKLFKPDAGSSQQAPGGFHTGDIGFVKGNVDASSHIAYEGAKAGNILNIIGIPQPKEAGVPHAICPICGIYPETRDSFHCLHCNRDWICLRHRDSELNWCQDCAAAEKTLKEKQALKAETITLDRESQKRMKEETRRDLPIPTEKREELSGVQKPPLVQLVGQGIVKTSMPEQKVATILIDVLQAFGAKNVHLDPDTRTVKGTTGLNWQSIGQIVSATIQPLPDGCSISIKSRPKPPTLLDSGRSSADVRKITDLLMQRLTGIL